MGFHTAMFYATSAAASLTQIAPATDGQLSITGNYIRIGQGISYLMGAYANGLHLIRARFESPSISNEGNQDINIEDIDVSADIVLATPPPYMDLFGTVPGGTSFPGALGPVPLKVNENLDCAIVTDTTSDEVFVVAWLGDGNLTPIPAGKKMPGVLATASVTLTAHTWTNCTLTFDQALGEGAYGIVGMRALSASGIAARLNVKGAAYRPGVLVSNTVPSIQNPRFRYGNLGLLATFTNQNPPDVEFFAQAADSSETVIFDLIKMS